ncbi:velvet factor-domain-containing protein [Crepidotus variabilis]|uniref:Velvet factor-domain-containing protein n=1 Tax=Crepidotus variabilis TaxID=179855 RepID=A0A9P6E9X8_9AGAR|nr:velvet factor-domain-containing protein [Crepidotus variabilis]
MFPEHYASTGRAPPTGSSTPSQHGTQNVHSDERLSGAHSREPTGIGSSINFLTGQFAGSNIRMELEEIQTAQLGRKYARVDRRPLDPPPVTHLRIFSVQGAGTSRQTEVELDYDEVQSLSLLCTVDLFPVPDSFVDSHSSAKANLHHTIPASPSPTSSTTQSPQMGYHRGLDGSNSLHVGPNESHIRTGTSGETPLPAASQQTSQFSSYILPSQGDDVVHRIEDYSITEKSKQTQALAGATFVQAVKVDYQGKKAVLFVFSDLAVKIEGTFVLRYRVFDLFSSQNSQNKDAIITAENYGGAFRVYSTKEFPGLPPSTELTKHLARWGVRLNIRETERKRRKRSKTRSPSPT